MPYNQERIDFIDFIRYSPLAKKHHIFHDLGPPDSWNTRYTGERTI